MEEYSGGKIWDWRNMGSGEGQRGNLGGKYCRSLKRMFQRQPERQTERITQGNDLRRSDDRK